MSLGDLQAVMAHPSANPALVLAQAEAYSGLTGKTLQADARAGKLVATQRSEGGRWRVRLSDLNAYLDTQRRADFALAPDHNTDQINWAL